MMLNKNLLTLFLVPLLIGLILPVSGLTKSLWEEGQRSDYADKVGVEVGDILMIEVEESATASSESDREREKNIDVGGESNANAPGSNIFNTLVDAIPLFNIGFTGSSSYSSDRELDADGSLNTQMSVKVVEKRSNGIIKLKGERKMKLDDTVKTLTFEGIARVEDVRPNNTIPSQRIANAKIFYEGRLGLTDGLAKNVFTKGWVWVKNTLFY